MDNFVCPFVCPVCGKFLVTVPGFNYVYYQVCPDENCSFNQKYYIYTASSSETSKFKNENDSIKVDSKSGA